jgi:hypothetical protein
MEGMDACAGGGGVWGEVGDSKGGADEGHSGWQS